MGASGWSYWTPYQADINKALQDLRQQIFHSGDFYNGYPGITDDEIIEMYEDVGLDAESINAQLNAIKDDPIERLLMANGFDGTHSILDVRRIVEQDSSSNNREDAAQSGIGLVFPISAPDLQRYFATPYPTHAQLEGALEDVRNSCQRWTGKYIVAYQGSMPTEILFVGITGD